MVLNTPMPTPSPSPTPRVMPTVPLFEHGYGRGGFGCVSVNPPVFLSESEALDVIREVAEREGIDFSETASINTQIPAIHVDNAKNGYKEAILLETGSLRLDGYDSEKSIAFEFVSTTDVDSWRKDQIAISFTSYPVIDVAKGLIDGLETTDREMSVAVFYDPAASLRDLKESNKPQTVAQAITEVKELAKEDLRAQVRDFIAWLKAEGII